MIDWITIKQRHRLEMVDGIPVPLPTLDGGYFVSVDRKEDGTLEEEFSTSKRMQHSASHETSVQIMCDGTTVTVSGNIGRLGREDNVFNLTFEQTMSKLNTLLAKYNLPPFTFEEPQYFYDQQSQKLELHTHFGAVITMLHICRNYKAGKGQAVKMLDLLATKSIGHVKNGRSPDGDTVYWGRKGGRRYTKAYVKHIEMYVNARKKHGKKYADALAQTPIYKYCEENGLVRIELEIDRDTLREKGFRYGQGLNMTELRKLFDERVNEIVQLENVTATEHDISHLPKKLHLIASAYFQGLDLAGTMPKSTFYDNARKLRAYGIDISVRYKGQRTFNPIIKHISLINAQQPSWYETTGSVEYVKRQHLRVM